MSNGIPIHVITQEEVDEWEAEQPTIEYSAQPSGRQALEEFMLAAERDVDDDPDARSWVDQIDAAMDEGADLIDVLEAIP